jgi:hypothetical protein
MYLRSGRYFPPCRAVSGDFITVTIPQGFSAKFARFKVVVSP